MPDLDKFREQARSLRKSHKKFLRRLKERPPKDLDSRVLRLDEEVFESIDCLECANCCKSISPIFQPKDVERIASRLKMRPGHFTETYLRTDEDGDLVLKGSPCPFLGPDNYCAVYEDRPRACREYPHTGQRKFHSRIRLAEKNRNYCPAVLRIIEALQAEMEA